MTIARLSRVYLDSQGYDKLGAYYGRGAKVWSVAYEASPLRDIDFRSNDLQSARAYVRSHVERNGGGDVRFVR